MRAWRIFCGMARSTGPPVTRAELHSFLADQVASRFESFTISATRGFWRALPEASIVIEIVDDRAASETAVREIARAYKQRFAQDAVLVVTNPVDAALV